MDFFLFNQNAVGPLHDTTTNRQVGIVSYGEKNCSTATPSILCRVTDNLDFIDEIIKKTSPSPSPAPNGYPLTMFTSMFRPKN